MNGNNTGMDGAADPPHPPPATFLPCRRLNGVPIYNPSTGETEVADDVIILQPSLDPIVLKDVNDIGTLDIKAPSPSNKCSKSASASDVKTQATGQRAYWLRRTLREGKFGRIRYAIALQRRTEEVNGQSNVVDWELTDIKVAVKKYTLERVAELRSKVADDPIKGIAARQYMACHNAPAGESFQERVKRAVNCMIRSHVVTPIDVWVDNLHIYQVMPYCGAELFEVISLKEHRFTEAQARHWMGHILNALDFLHNKVGIVHRDIRPENILLHEESDSLVLIDFGLCLLLPQNESRGQLIKPQGICGTLPFVAPEIAANEAFDGRAVDLFQAGVVLFVMVTGFPPFSRPDTKDVRFNLINSGNLDRMLRSHNLGLSLELLDLLQNMLRLNASDRLTLEEVAQHPWMTMMAE